MNSGDYILYSFYGVCLIDEITEKEILGEMKQFVSFHPVYDSNLKIMVPVDNPNIIKREILTKAQAEKLLEDFEKVDPVYLTNNDLRKNYFQEQLKKCDPLELMTIIKSLYIHDKEIRMNKKFLSMTDSKTVKSAEMILLSELTVALGKSVDEVLADLKSRIYKLEA